MFTGIIETTGKIVEIKSIESLIEIYIQSSFNNELVLGQSIAHNGICLTVTCIFDDIYVVTAVAETIRKTTVQYWQVNDVLNLERCLAINGRLDGHIVQGHVDCIAQCIDIDEKSNSREYQFSYDEAFRNYLIEKGSICIDGISVTCFNITASTFTVAIIPHTYTTTSIQYCTVGKFVNIEFDVIGKYVNKIMTLRMG